MKQCALCYGSYGYALDIHRAFAQGPYNTHEYTVCSVAFFGLGQKSLELFFQLHYVFDLLKSVFLKHILQRKKQGMIGM